MKKTKKQKTSKLPSSPQPVEIKIRNSVKGSFPVSFRSQYILPCFFIALLSISIYSNTLKNGFVYDDMAVVAENDLIKDFSNLSSLFKSDYFARSGEATYRPIVTFSYFLDYAIYGRDPWGYHLTNILLHAANGVLIYIFLTLLSTHSNAKEYERGVLQRLSTPSLIISLLFLFNPILTEAVNAIAFREDLLVFFFFLATLNIYLSLRLGFKTQATSSYILYAISCLFYFLALLSKEMAITLPLIIYCYEWVYADKGSRYLSVFNRYSICYIAVTIAYIYIRFYHFHGPVEEGAISWGLIEIISTIPWLLFSYLKQTLFPVLLSLEYQIKPLGSFFSLLSLGPLLIIMLLLATTFLMRAKSRLKAFGVLFFFITLIPVYNIIHIANPFAERYLYLPTLGLTIAAGSGISHLLKIQTSKINLIVIVLLIFILSIYSMAVIKRNRIWKDDYSLLSDTIKRVPESSRAHLVLGYVYARQRDFSTAAMHFQTSIKLNPNVPHSHYYLGKTYLEQGRFDEAIQEYQSALRLKPSYSDAHADLGIIYASQGKLEEAIQEYQAAIRLKPNNSDYYSNLGLAYYLNKHPDKAIEYYLIALKFGANKATMHNNLGLAYQMQGRLDKAIDEYMTALNLDPTHANGHYNLANTYLTQGRKDLAKRELEIVLQLNPNDSEALKTLNDLKK